MPPRPFKWLFLYLIALAIYALISFILLLLDISDSLIHTICQFGFYLVYIGIIATIIAFVLTLLLNKHQIQKTNKDNNHETTGNVSIVLCFIQHAIHNKFVVIYKKCKNMINLAKKYKS